jgi:hypothetical protein
MAAPPPRKKKPQGQGRKRMSARIVEDYQMLFSCQVAGRCFCVRCRCQAAAGVGSRAGKAVASL